jgi:carboxyl-terminal processing protease
MKTSAIACAFLLLFCGGWMPTSDAVKAAEPDALSARDRVEVLETVWKTISDEYYDPAFNGVNWSAARERYRPRVEAAKDDEEFYAIVSQMLSELHDLHTSFVAPNEQSRSSGISVYEVEGKIVVVSVEPDSEAERKGVKAGMIVHAFDGRPIDERLSEIRAKAGSWSNVQAYRFLLSRLLLAGPVNSTFRLDLERADGTSFEVAVTRRVISTAQPKLISYRLQSGFSYMKISRALLSPVDDQFESEFKTLKDSPGLVIDLRGISGGDIKGVGLKIANYFFASRVSFGKFLTRSGETAPHRSLSAGGGNQIYGGPVVILIDEATRSAGEVFATGFQENGRARIVGLQSCGCVLDRDSKKVKGGGVLYYSHFGYVSAKGHKLEGAGVMPDQIVPLTIAALRQGRDETLAEAERLLRPR